MSRDGGAAVGRFRVWLRVAVATALLGAGCAGPQVGAVSPPAGVEDGSLMDPPRSLWALVPSQADIVMVVDVAQLRRSGWTRDALTAADQDERQARAAARGFDEVADVDQLVLVRLPETAEGGTLTLLAGRFEPQRLVGALGQRWPGATSSDFRGVTVWSQGDEAQALIDDRTLASGPLTGVRAAIDCARGRAEDVRRVGWLQTTRLSLREGRPLRGTAPAVELAVALSPALRAQLRSELGEGDALERLGARLDVGETLDVHVVGATNGRRQASDMAARLGDLVGQLARRRSMVALGLADVLGHVRLSAEGSRVVADLRLTDDQREQIAGRLAAVTALLARARAGGPARAPAP